MGSCQCQFSVASGDALGFLCGSRNGGVSSVPGFCSDRSSRLRFFQEWDAWLDAFARLPASTNTFNQTDQQHENEHDYDFRVSQEAPRRGPFLPGARRPWRRSCGD